MTVTEKRIYTFVAVLAVYVGVVWFSVWGYPPSEWQGVERFISAIMGISIPAFAATFPFED